MQLSTLRFHVELTSVGVLLPSIALSSTPQTKSYPELQLFSGSLSPSTLLISCGDVRLPFAPHASNC